MLHRLLKLRSCFPDQFSLWLPVGGRLDLLAAMETAMVREWPNRSVFTVVLGQEKQKKGKRDEYALWMPLDGDSCPALIDCSKCRAKASECMRQRCFIATCPHHTASTGADISLPLLILRNIGGDQIRLGISRVTLGGLSP